MKTYLLSNQGRRRVYPARGSYRPRGQWGARRRPPRSPQEHLRGARSGPRRLHTAELVTTIPPLLFNRATFSFFHAHPIRVLWTTFLLLLLSRVFCSINGPLTHAVPFCNSMENIPMRTFKVRAGALQAGAVAPHECAHDRHQLERRQLPHLAIWLLPYPGL